MYNMYTKTYLMLFEVIAIRYKRALLYYTVLGRAMSIYRV